MPGTLNDTDQSNITAERSNVPMITIPSIPMAIDSTTGTFTLEVGSCLLYYVVLGITAGAVVLTFGFIIVCVLIGFSVQRKRKSHTFTIAATLQVHNDIQTQGMVYYMNHTDILILLLCFALCPYYCRF